MPGGTPLHPLELSGSPGGVFQGRAFLLYGERQMLPDAEGWRGNNTASGSRFLHTQLPALRKKAVHCTILCKINGQESRASQTPLEPTVHTARISRRKALLSILYDRAARPTLMHAAVPCGCPRVAPENGVYDNKPQIWICRQRAARKKRHKNRRVNMGFKKEISSFSLFLCAFY